MLKVQQPLSRTRQGQGCLPIMDGCSLGGNAKTSCEVTSTLLVKLRMTARSLAVVLVLQRRHGIKEAHKDAKSVTNRYMTSSGFVTVSIRCRRSWRFQWT